MTKKDYIAIANVIKDVKATVTKADERMTINAIVNNLIQIFKIDNVNFDSQRFINYILDKNKRYKDFTDK